AGASLISKVTRKWQVVRPCAPRSCAQAKALPRMFGRSIKTRDMTGVVRGARTRGASRTPRFSWDDFPPLPVASETRHVGYRSIVTGRAGRLTSHAAGAACHPDESSGHPPRHRRENGVRQINGFAGASGKPTFAGRDAAANRRDGGEDGLPSGSRDRDARAAPVGEPERRPRSDARVPGREEKARPAPATAASGCG